MKRYLKKNRHSLSSGQKQELWLAISQNDSPARRSARPVWALSSVAAMLVVLVAWWYGTATEKPRGIVGPNTGVVVLPPEMQTETIEVRDPAADARASTERRKAALSTGDPQDQEAEVGELLATREIAAAPAPVGGVIRGIVTDAETGQGLDYATVLVRGTPERMMTLGGGHFKFTKLEPGQSYQLQVQRLGYSKLLIDAVAGDVSGPELVVALNPAVVDTVQPLLVESSLDQQLVIRKYALDSVEEALSKQAGASAGPGANAAPAPREGTIALRGGRSGEIRFQSGRAIALSDPGGAGSITGGTKPPNGKQVELMYFEGYGVNPFVATEDDALSTFAVDVDNASWTVTRNYLHHGMLPPKDAIRVEEFVNAFDSGWPSHTGETFRIHADGAPSRFGSGYQLLRIGLVGKSMDESQRKPANLIFVVDISGSMNRENRLGLVKRSLRVLLDELDEGDRVGIVVYGSHGRVLLEPTDLSRREVIEAAIANLGPGGSTNAFEGLELAYSLARREYEAQKINRLILCSDGVANQGASTEAETMLTKIRRASDEGITLSTIGFGMGNYNDVLMEKLADQGDGNYYYVDRFDEAERVFRENLTGLLQTIAREVKVQVEFDPSRVARWRLLGYENRDVADRDFRNDAVDAGEVGVGHQVTALYELKLIAAEDGSVHPDDGEGDETSPVHDSRLGTIRLRYEAPAHDIAHAGQVEEIDREIRTTDLSGAFCQSSVWLRTQAVVAEFAEILRGSYWARESRLADLVPVADALVAEVPGDEDLQELAELIRTAARIQADQPVREESEKE